jgi:hypothetical protein
VDFHGNEPDSQRSEYGDKSRGMTLVVHLIKFTQARQCTYKRNIEAHSRNHCCRGKAISITYCECECVCILPRVVTGEKNSPTAAHASRKRRPKWVPSAWGYSWATLPRGL